jgi:hypothetical protein
VNARSPHQKNVSRETPKIKLILLGLRPITTGLPGPGRTMMMTMIMIDFLLPLDRHHHRFSSDVCPNPNYNDNDTCQSLIGRHYVEGYVALHVAKMIHAIIRLVHVALMWQNIDLHV